MDTAFEITSRATLRLCGYIADELLDVLEHGTLDEASRESIGRLYRGINQTAARVQEIRNDGNYEEPLPTEGEE